MLGSFIFCLFEFSPPTKMEIIWFGTLIVTYQFVMEVLFPMVIVYARFIFNKNSNEEGVLSKYWRYRKDHSGLIDRDLLKDYLTIFETIYTIIMTINNYPFAVLNIISLGYYLHISHEMRQNGWFRNTWIVLIPLLIFFQLNLTFYTWNSYMPMLRYMLIEYQTTGGGIYFYLFFNFCPFAQDIIKILF